MGVDTIFEVKGCNAYLNFFLQIILEDLTRQTPYGMLNADNAKTLSIQYHQSF